MQPASGLPCSTEALIASVSSTSMLSRLSFDHTFQARLAIGQAFHSISGMLTANTTGLALKAIASDSVGSASGICLETAGGLAVAGVAPEVTLDVSALISSTVARRNCSS